MKTIRQALQFVAALGAVGFLLAAALYITNRDDSSEAEFTAGVGVERILFTTSADSSTLVRDDIEQLKRGGFVEVSSEQELQARIGSTRKLCS